MDFFSDYHDYHLKVVDTLKTVLYQKDNDIFDKLDFYDDDVFLEPLLFSCINTNYENWIDAIIFCLSKKRHSLSPVKVKISDNSTIYLPNIGYLHIADSFNGKYVLISSDKEGHMNVSDESNIELHYELSSIIKNRQGIEFLIYNHELIQPLFVDEEGNSSNVTVSQELYEKHIENFNKALGTIKIVYPDYHKLVVKYIKKVVFYKGVPNSFATIQAHGMVFFNVLDEYNEVFFLDNIMHQCAHVFFNVLTFDKKELFTLSPTSSLTDFTGDKEDKRFVLYDRFHGLFTQTNINICLEQCFHQKLFSGDQHNELVGRFVSNMKRFTTAIDKFNRPDKYRTEGLDWFCYFKKVLNDIYTKNSILLNRHDVSNQPYVFNYKIYKKTNNLK